MKRQTNQMFGMDQKSGMRYQAPCPVPQGLGTELAQAFAAHGARLILSARRREQLQARGGWSHCCFRQLNQSFCTSAFLLMTLVQAMSCEIGSACKEPSKPPKHLIICHTPLCA